MKGDKIDAIILDKLAGGVIVDGDLRGSIDGDIITVVEGGETRTMGVSDFRDQLLGSGHCDAVAVDKLISMIASDKDYSFADIENATGIKITHFKD